MTTMRRPPERVDYRAKLARSRRAALEDWIERLIALLDALDGDPDLEPAGFDELSLQPISLRGGAHVRAL